MNICHEHQNNYFVFPQHLFTTNLQTIILLSSSVKSTPNFSHWRSVKQHLTELTTPDKSAQVIQTYFELIQL